MNMLIFCTSLIKPGRVPLIHRECQWRSDLPIVTPGENDRITTYHESYSFVYTYSFTLRFEPAIYLLIIEFCRYFNVCLGQICPIVWSEVACLCYLSNLIFAHFTFQYLLHLYSPKLFCVGIFTIAARSKRVVVGPEDVTTQFSP